MLDSPALPRSTYFLTVFHSSYIPVLGCFYRYLHAGCEKAMQDRYTTSTRCFAFCNLSSLLLDPILSGVFIFLGCSWVIAGRMISGEAFCLYYIFLHCYGGSLGFSRAGNHFIIFLDDLNNNRLPNISFSLNFEFENPFYSLFVEGKRKGEKLEILVTKTRYVRPSSSPNREDLG